MAKDFIPRSSKNLAEWLNKQLTGTAAHTAAIGSTAAEVTAYLAHITPLHTQVQQIVDLNEQLDQKIADLNQMENLHLPPIRAFIKRAKTAVGFPPSIAEELDWLGDSNETDPNTSRPTIDVRVVPGRIIIDGRKPGFEAVSLYSRIKGGVAWKLIATRKRRFPIYDETPLAVAGVPEVREYQAWGVVDDEQTGQPSEIKEVVFIG